ncbi:fat-like cadherin-related tumor suppressor homolog [Teleopsis dalmanni]|uniref:fat-like cadherin-related tumor suppressor homolog n=1 Tax=Teleopsis dalmanni TaxID=139649 RepID=UPI0018CD51F5|nr:fat-like cadherin-related tumor suppressor homolog [Teleopsis dalmanni]
MSNEHTPVPLRDIERHLAACNDVLQALAGEIVTTELKLDRENQAEHTIEISISDNNLLELTSITRVVIIVEDVNDHSPEFDNRFYRIEVPSTTKINNSIYQVHAFDSDFGENSRITYSMKSGKGKSKFRIDSKTGAIYLLNYLDKATEYDLIIRAEDNGSPKRSQTARMSIVSVFVSQKSKHPPVIKTVDNVVKVTEGDPPGFFITLIQAGDVDGDRLWYIINGGNDFQNFYIGRENGNVILIKQLDWEEEKYHNLTIVVTDGTNIVQTQLYIEVIDINDNRPEFTQNIYYINISESINEETDVMHLQAFDKDEENKIYYSLSAAQDLSSLTLFKIDSQSGIISLKHRLDYEKKSKHILIAIAKDQGTPCKRSFAKIFITVLDQNNHIPEFSKRIIQSRIPESAAVGSKIIQVYAADRDDGKNAEVRYSIAAGNFGNIFALDQNLGVLSISKPISNNEMVEFMIHIRATDLGEPPLSSQMSVHLLLTKSENDPPRFRTPMFVVEINENIPFGTYITQIEAHSSSSVFYEITDGNNDNLFHINPSTGIIVSNYIIDFEHKRVFNLTVTAINMASFTATQYVVVHILDQNDNIPYFLETRYEGEISESAKIGSLVFQLPARKKRIILS